MDKPTPSSIPTTPGVYLYKDAGGRILYVGKARNLRKRVLSYFRPEGQLTSKTVAMLRHAESLDTLSTTTEKEALLLEASLIKKHRPRYNIVLRDDKQYVLFRIDGRKEYPRLEITRKTRKRDGARYFGPFTSAGAARETWKSIHRAFPIRRCSDRAMNNRVRPCLYHHIGQCLAPCTGQVSREEYGAITHRIELLLSGKSGELLELLRKNMEDAAESLEFEKAAALRDQIQAVEATLEKQAVVLQSQADMDVIGLATRPDGLALSILFVRQGMLLDSNAFSWPGLTLEDAPELLHSFLSQFYGPQSAVPPRILVPWLSLSQEPVEEPPAREAPLPLAEVEDTPDQDLRVLESALSDMRGSPVRIVSPRTADDNRLMDMAHSNARESARCRADIPLAERLATVMQASRPIVRIECVDVSHTSGQATKVGMVVYEGGKPLKSDYRVWNMHDTHGDDHAALHQWAGRRLEHGPPWPDLLLVDGGKGQVATVERVMRLGFAGESFQAFEPALTAAPELERSALPFTLAGIAKARDEDGKADRRAGNVADRIFLPGRSNPLPIREGSAELLFLQAVRDATHDFAIGRHRQARAKQALDSELMRLHNVGPHTARLLWDHFQNLEAMRQATEEELANLPGIGPQKAKALHKSLKEL